MCAAGFPKPVYGNTSICIHVQAEPCRALLRLQSRSQNKAICESDTRRRLGDGSLARPVAGSCARISAAQPRPRQGLGLMRKRSCAMLGSLVVVTGALPRTRLERTRWGSRSARLRSTIQIGDCHIAPRCCDRLPHAVVQPVTVRGGSCKSTEGLRRPPVPLPAD